MYIHFHLYINNTDNRYREYSQLRKFMIETAKGHPILRIEELFLNSYFYCKSPD